MDSPEEITDGAVRKIKGLAVDNPDDWLVKNAHCSLDDSLNALNGILAYLKRGEKLPESMAFYLGKAIIAATTAAKSDVSFVTKNKSASSKKAAAALATSLGLMGSGARKKLNPEFYCKAINDKEREIVFRTFMDMGDDMESKLDKLDAAQIKKIYDNARASAVAECKKIFGVTDQASSRYLIEMDAKWNKSHPFPGRWHRGQFIPHGRDL